jgi:four helix bundle protein
VENFEQDLKERMKRLGVEVIQLVERLPRRQGAEIIGKQIIRCSTSIGANYRAACRARSRADFIAKLAIAEEESDETPYWLEVLADLKLLDAQSFGRLHQEAEEITKILTASGKTAKQSMTVSKQPRSYTQK